MKSSLFDSDLLGCQILIFSQLRTMLDILHGYIQLMGVGCARIDGHTKRSTNSTNPPTATFNIDLTLNIFAFPAVNSAKSKLPRSMIPTTSRILSFCSPPVRGA